MAEEEWHHRLNNPELRCKNKCGFYGNAIYQGYCSKCYKEIVRDGSRKIGKVMQDVEEEGDTTGGLGFSKFAIRKSLFSTAKGHGKLFKNLRPGTALSLTGSTNTSGGATSAISPTPTNGQEQKKKSRPQRNSDPFNEFMKTIKKPAAQDIVQHLKTFKKQIMERSVSTVAEQSEAVQGFYESTSRRLTSHPLFDQMGEEEQEETMDGIEKHLMTSIYNKVFSPASCDDEIKDILLLRRINLLHWLEPVHLDVALDMVRPDVQEVFGQARQELWNMENKKAPQDKLNCISRSCKKLLEALNMSQGGPASADEFLPSVIFLIIHTSPQHLYSNINYIERFSNPNRLLSGEAGYYFTNMYSAVIFIENISAYHLKLTQDEFNSKMGYINGKTDADLLIEEDDIQEDFDRIIVLQSCCAAMKELTDRMQMMVVDCNDLKSQMDEFQIGIKEQVESILRQPPPKSLYKAGITGYTQTGTDTTGLTGISSHGDQTQPEIPNPPNSPLPLISFD